ncbi:putative DNA binding domain-containing protein [Acidovorax sp. SUPP2522]|nr:putative DNA binding domain-containing protein [Acidovorax sp. SUPP2522]
MVLWAPGGQNRPYKVPEAVTARHKVWYPYIRRYSSTVQAKGEAEQELLSLTAKVPWDDRFCQATTVASLSKPLMQAFLQEVDSALAADAADLSVEALGRQMNVVGGPAESPWPKNVGLLFFNEAPTDFFPGAQVDVVAFPQGTGGDVIVEKSFQGPLSRMVREALDYLQRNYLHETVAKHPQRAEATRAWNFPFAAVEEALVNAVYHRTYESHDPVEVRIGPDELVVLSYPGPDRSVRLEDLRTGRAVSRRYRNRRIGEFLKELRLTEGRATGIPKILKAMRANGSPEPVFETDDERLSFVVRLPVHPLAQPITAEVAAEVTAEVARLLGVLQGEMPRASLMDAVGLKHAEHFRKAYLLPALAAGLVERTMPDKPNSKNQRYRITASGTRWLRQHAGERVD